MILEHDIKYFNEVLQNLWDVLPATKASQYWQFRKNVVPSKPRSTRWIQYKGEVFSKRRSTFGLEFYIIRSLKYFRHERSILWFGLRASSREDMSSLLNHLESTQFSFKHWSYRENFPGGGQPVYEGNRPQYLGIYEVDSKSGHEPIQDFISRCITFIEEICIYLLQEARLEDASAEVARLKRWAEISVRGDQTKFSESIRQAYEGRCAVTACSTGRVLEAAHIRVDDDHAVDFSDITNGILLRADIHALFDAHLITLSADGTSLEISEGIDDPCYEFLKTVRVKRPPSGQAPSPENISHRRKRFLEAQKNP